MYFKRKGYEKLLEWKSKCANKYAVLLEGVRRVGKSTIAKLFAENEYKTYILIDFSIASNDVISCFILSQKDYQKKKIYKCFQCIWLHLLKRND